MVDGMGGGGLFEARLWVGRLIDILTGTVGVFIIARWRDGVGYLKIFIYHRSSFSFPVSHCVSAPPTPELDVPVGRK